ncbi:MAG: hypothetical protein LUD81_11525 [Clostridiales bacterium]|nr:hypothetical protein [Clostridiales bacterium]
MIWNLPTVVIHFISGFDYMNSVLALLWCKLLIVLANIGIIVVINKILKLFDDERDLFKSAALLFAVNTCVIIPSMVAVQYDNLSLLCVLAGLYFYIKNDNKKFTLFFAAAVPLKSFAVFVYIPLLLMKEKNIARIILKTAVVFVIQLVFALPFIGDTYYKIAVGRQNRDAVSLILGAATNIAGYNINLFAFMFIAICVFCYADKSSDEKDRAYKSIYVSFASFVSLICFMSIRSYWVILVVPFAVMTACLNKRHFTENVLVLIISTASYTLHGLMNHWIYSIDRLVSFLALKSRNIDSSALRYGSIKGFFEYYGLTKYSHFLYSIFFAGMFILLILNIPKFVNIKKPEESGCSIVSKYGPLLCFLQNCITAAVIFILLYANLANAGHYVYDTTAGESLYVESRLENKGTALQSFMCESDDIIESITFKADNKIENRQNRSALKFEISDNKTGKILARETVGVNMISSQNDFTIKFNKAKIEKGHIYTVKFQGIGGTNEAMTDIFLARTEELIYGDFPAYIDGEPKDYNLSLKIR